MAYKNKNKANECSKFAMRRYRERLRAKGYVLRWIPAEAYNQIECEKYQDIEQVMETC